MSNHILSTELLHWYFSLFNSEDEEYYINTVDNAHAAAFMEERTPLFSCPDKEMEKTYYFRWWVYRKHLKLVNGGYVVTEFLPEVYWAGTYNTILLAAGQHIMEGRWLRDTAIIEDYSRFWYQRCEKSRYYTTTVPFAVERFCDVLGDYTVAQPILKGMAEDYRQRERGIMELGVFMSKRECGLFFNTDNMDGGEYSIGGDGYRPYCNCAMYGNAAAIARLADRLGFEEMAREFGEKASRLGEKIEDLLWNEKHRFFEVRREDGSMSDVRELYGYAPWYFGTGRHAHADCWAELVKADGFSAPYGLTYPEQRHRDFSLLYMGHECQWNGPIWPYATSITLTALANYLEEDESAIIGKREYFDILSRYARSHRRIDESGRVKMWIDENQNPYTGEWMSRTILQNGPADRITERGKDYNHSTFCDLIITGLVGLRPDSGERLTLRPLLPQNTWDYFCLDGISYHGHDICIVWDKNNQQYGRGKGLCIWVDGHLEAQSETLGPLEISLKTSTEGGA